MTTDIPAVRAGELGVRYPRGDWALQDCTLDIPPGRVVGVVGPNGAGKTTLLRVLAGQLAPTTGFALVGSVDARTPAHLRPLGARVRLLNQERHLYTFMSAAELLDFGRRTNRYWDGRLARRWLEAYAVVRADVTAGLLSVSSERGTTIMLSTHAIAELGGVIDHLVLLADSRLLLAEAVDDILATHVCCTGPADEALPCPGTPVHVHRTERTITTVVRTGGHPDRPDILPAAWQRRMNLTDEPVAGPASITDPQPRTITFGDLSWLTWRMHRGLAIAVGLDHGNGCAGVDGYGVGSCANSVIVTSRNLASVLRALVFLPALAGAFCGAPLIARELETGTITLALALGVAVGTFLRRSLPAVACTGAGFFGAWQLLRVIRFAYLSHRSTLHNHAAWAGQFREAGVCVAAAAVLLYVAFARLSRPRAAG